LAPDRRQISLQVHRLALPAAFGKAWAFAYDAMLRPFTAPISFVVVFQEIS
jgi:hypothetical protein